jgi:RNA polymerase sigma-70 factor (ECF subfamily)
VVQDVFASTVRSHKKLGEVRDLTAYLFVSLRRAAGQCALRRIQSAQAAAAAANERTREKNATIADHDHCDRLQEAIDALPEEQREVLTLKIDGELTFSQIANVMGGTVSTAASRYQYALRKLRSSLAGANPSLEKTS